MQSEHLKSLAALAQHGSPVAAAHAIRVDEAQIRDAIVAAEAIYGGVLVDEWLDNGTPRFTTRGQAVLQAACRSQAEWIDLKGELAVLQRRGVVAGLTQRRSISPKRLGLPGPDGTELALMVEAALRGPDHGGLHPWRVIEFGRDTREGLARLFEQEKLRRDPLTSAQDLARARAHALRTPVLLGFVVSLAPRSSVPQREQWLAAGAALGNLLNAAHQLGFGAIVLSGERCFDEVLVRQLGIGADEFLAGFVSVGSIVSQPAAAKTVAPHEVWSRWSAPVDGLASSDSPTGTPTDIAE